MFVLHVDLKVRSDSSRILEDTYREIFRPAISSQPGFGQVQLLQSAADQNGYRLVIAFQDEPSQKAWVATQLHQEVWPKMEKNCSSYKVETFQAV
jgi:heme-degrading monooxygenase HmoA